MTFTEFEDFLEKEKSHIEWSEDGDFFSSAMVIITLS